MRMLLPLVSSLAAGLAWGAEPAVTAFRIVDCDQPVQSRKRGVCVNRLDAADFRALAPGVSWWYNWHVEVDPTPVAGVPMDFIPMAWGDQAGFLSGLEAYLATGAKPRAIFAINEPNLRGQAFITPAETAAAFAAVKRIADAHGIAVVGPHMALGSPLADSITADDPIEGKPVTYTYMNPFLKAFLHVADGAKTAVPALGVHSYGGAGELKWLVDMMHQEFKRPVWVTEYAWEGVPNDAAMRDHLIETTDFLERSPHVAGYAWFKERSGVPHISLLGPVAGELTDLGRTYVAMPVHDADIAYRIPGRLQAEKYTAIAGMEVRATDDADGFLHTIATEAGSWADYQVRVDKAATFAVTLRATGGGTDRLRISADGAPLAEVPWSGEAWQSLTTSVALGEGVHRLRISGLGGGRTLNWIGFAAVP